MSWVVRFWLVHQCPSVAAKLGSRRAFRRMRDDEISGGCPRSSDLLVGLGLRRPVRCLGQCADDATPRQLNLEGIVLVSPGFAQQDIRRARESRLFCRLVAQCAFGFTVTPRLMRNSAKRKPRIPDCSAVKLQCSGD